MMSKLHSNSCELINLNRMNKRQFDGIFENHYRIRFIKHSACTHRGTIYIDKYILFTDYGPNEIINVHVFFFFSYNNITLC